MGKSKSTVTMSAIKADPEDGSEEDWKANQAFRTLVDAEGHRKDPAMMKRVAKVAERHVSTATKVMKSVDDLKAHAKATFPPSLKYEKKA